MTRRYASSTAQRTQLTGTISAFATTILVAGTPGFPGTRPYTLIIDPDTINEEVVTCTAVSGTTLTVIRGEDGTTATGHDIGAVVMHGWSGRDVGEPQAHMDATEAHGSVGDLVGEDNTQTLTNKAMSGADNTFSNIPQSAVTNLVSALAAKAPIDSPTFTGTPVLPATTSIGDVSATEMQRLNGVTGNVQTQLDTLSASAAAKAPIDSPTFTGTVTLPSSTTIGAVTAAEIARLTGVLSNIQAQIDEVIAGGGIPAGGTEGQVLAKASGTDYDVEWIDVTSAGGGSSVIATAPYPTGGTEGSGETDCWLTYTDGVTGYEYRVHKFLASGLTDSLTVSNGVIGTLLVVGAGGRGGYYAGGSTPSNAGAGAGGAVYEQPYAFGSGIHNCYVGRGANSTRATAETSKFDDIWAYGGGQGGPGGNLSEGGPGSDGGNGGGGGKGAFGVSAGGAATYGSINAGVSTNTSLFDAEAGANGTSGEGGGSEWTSDISGTSVTYSYGGLRDGSPAEWDEDTGSGGHALNADGPDGKNGVIYVRYRIA